MGFTDLSGPVLLPVAANSKLSACVHRDRGQTFVSVHGPCGQGHTMNLEEARALRDWLIGNIPTDEADQEAWAALKLKAARASDGDMWESA
jgi:hypothetical protein